MSKDFVQPKNPNFSIVHSRIRNDRKMWPRFKDCNEAIDGTHIFTTVAPEDQVRYIGRQGSATQNVMAVCDFDIRFTYTSIRQLGAMHDTSVLYHELDVDREVFPHHPQGKYYLIIVGYPNRPDT